MGFLDVPGRPDEPGCPERASTSGADRPTPISRELPDPDERGRIYEAMRAHASAETAGESSDAAGESQHDQRADGAGQRAYRDEVPRFVDMWADHERRWPEMPRHAADLPTSHHRDSGLRPSPERQAETAEAIGRVREAEPGLSADAQAIERENKDTHDGWLEGFENRLKGEDRLLEKVAEGLTTTSPDATPKQVLRLIPDAIRFTYCFQAESYTRGSTPGTLGVSVFLGCSAFRVLYVFLSLFSWWCRRRAGTGGTRVSRRVRRAVPRSAAPGRGGLLPDGLYPGR